MSSKYVKCLAFMCLMFLVSCVSAYAALLNDIVVANSSGQVKIVNGLSLTTIASTSGLGNVTSVAVQRSGKIVVGNASGTLYLRNGSDLSAITSSNGADSGHAFGCIRDISVQSNDNIVVGSDDANGRIYVRNASSLAHVWSDGGLNWPGSSAISGLAVQPDDDIAVGNSGGGAWIHSGSLSQTWLASRTDLGSVAALAMQPDGTVVVGGSLWGGWIFKMSGTNLDGASTVVYGFGTVYDVVVDPYGDVVVAGSANGGSVWLRRGTDLDGLASNSNLPNITAVAVQSNGDIVCGTSTGTIMVLRDNGAGQLQLIASQTGFGSITDLVVVPYMPSAAPDDIVVANSSGYVTVIDGPSLMPTVSTSGLGNITALGVQKAGNIVVGNQAGVVYLRNAFDLGPVASDGVGAGTPIRDLAVQADDDVIAACDLLNGTVRLRASTDLRCLHDISNLGTLTSVAVMKGVSGGVDVTDHVAVGNTAGNMYLLDRTELTTYAWGPGWGYVRDIAGLPNGNIVFGTDANGGSMFIRTGKDFDGVTYSYGPFGTIYDMAVKPNGDIAQISSPYSGWGYVLSGTSLGLLASNPGLGTDVKAVVTLSNGDVAVGKSDGTIYLFDGSTFAVKGYVTGFGTITDLAVMNFPTPVANNEAWTPVTSTSKVGSTVYMNGSPFLPRILYGAEPNQVFKNQGFNIVHLQCSGYYNHTDAVNGIKKFLDRCQAVGMWGIVNFGGAGYFLNAGNFYETGIVNVLNADTGNGYLLKDHPALFCYELVDEPNDPNNYTSPGACQGAANAIKSTDTDHLVWVNLACTSAQDSPNTPWDDRYVSAFYNQYLSSQDIWSFDAYPLGYFFEGDTRSLIRTCFYPWTSQTDSDPNLRGTRPLGTFLQGYKIPDNPPFYYDWPTPDGFRAHTYGFIMHDYRWFATYVWGHYDNSPAYTLRNMPELWDYMRSINSEMLTLKPLILDPGFFTPVSYNGTKAPNGDSLAQDGRDIDVARKTVGGVTYLIAVNGLNVDYSNNVSVNVNMTGLNGFTWAERLFEGGTLSITNGVLSDSLIRYGVHVYILH